MLQREGAIRKVSHVLRWLDDVNFLIKEASISPSSADLDTPPDDPADNWTRILALTMPNVNADLIRSYIGS